MRANRPLPDRFYEPLTEQTLAELLAAQELLNFEVERVRRVCEYTRIHGLPGETKTATPVTKRLTRVK